MNSGFGGAQQDSSHVIGSSGNEYGYSHNQTISDKEDISSPSMQIEGSDNITSLRETFQDEM